jgi:hypothetical protein
MIWWRLRPTAGDKTPLPLLGALWPELHAVAALTFRIVAGCNATVERKLTVSLIACSALSRGHRMVLTGVTSPQ